MPRKVEPRRLQVTRYIHKVTGERLKKGQPDAIKKVEPSETYYAWMGREKGYVNLKTTDLGQAWTELRKLQRAAQLRAEGITDDYTDHALADLQAHVAAWEQCLRDRGGSSRGVGQIAGHVRKLAAEAGWQRLADVTAATCLRALAALVARKGLGPQTRNHYLADARQFCRWCWREKRLRDNPLEGLAKVSVETDRRHDRRCPSDEEITALFEYLARTDCRVRRGLSGPARALGYRVCMAAGLRAQELRSLSRESFDLDGATVTLRAAYDKRRRLVVQELPPWLVDELRAHFAGGGGCWDSLDAYHPGRVLKADLAAAGVAYSLPGPDGPRFFDMHALRIWYISMLADQPGISPKVLMTLARHSNPTLSLKVYARVRRHSLQAAVDAIPEPGKASGKKEQGKAG